MILKREQYEAVAKGEPLITHTRGKRRLRKPATSKSGFTNGPVTVIKPDGVIQEWEAFAANEARCPYPVGTGRYARFREDKPISWMRGDPLPPIQGGLWIVVSDAVLCETPRGWRWRITYHRSGRHRPIQEKPRGIYMAKLTGYGSRSTSIDPEAPVIPDEHVERFMAEDLAAKRKIQLMKMGKVADLIQEVKEDEHDTQTRRVIVDLDRAAARLKKMLAADDIAA